MTTATDLKSCRACAKYKAYRDGLCWGCHNEVERLQREYDGFDTREVSETQGETTSD